jgi:hypothetical protein
MSAHTLLLAHMGLRGAFHVRQDSTTMTRTLLLLAPSVWLVKCRAHSDRSLAMIVQLAHTSKTLEKPSAGTVQVADGLTRLVHLRSQPASSVLLAHSIVQSILTVCLVWLLPPLALEAKVAVLCSRLLLRLSAKMIRHAPTRLGALNAQLAST